MKWLKIFFLLTALFSSGFAFADSKSICEVRKEARQSMFNGDLGDINTFKVCSSSTGGKAVYYLASSYFHQNTLVQLTAKIFDFDYSIFPEQSFDIVRMICDVFVTLASSVATILILINMIKKIYRIAEAKEKDIGSVVSENKTFVISTLIFAVCVSPILLVPICIFIAFVVLASDNFIADDSQIYVLQHSTKNFEDSKAADKELTLDYYEDSESAISKIAVKEFKTKNAMLSFRAAEIQKGSWDGWQQSTLTKGEVLNILEKDVGVKFVTTSNDEKFTGLNMVWNSSFKGYSELAFGPANVLENISFNNLSNVENSGVESDSETNGLRVKGFVDPATFMTADAIKDETSKLKNVIYQSVLSGANDYKKHLDSEFVQKVSAFMVSKAEEVKKDLIASGIKEVDTTKYLSVFLAGSVNSLRGVNPNATYAGKYEVLKGFAPAVQIFTCSQDYEKHEILRKDIEKFNAIGNGTLFADQKVWMAAAKLDMSCAMIKDGKVIYTGVDFKNNPEKEKAVFATAVAYAEAGNLYDSQIIAGVLDAANKFSISADGLRNSILANTGVGSAGPAKNIKAYSIINTERGYIDMAVFNSVAVSYTGVGENEKYFDYVKLLNVKNFDMSKGSSKYNTIILDNQTIPLVNVFIGSGSKSTTNLSAKELSQSESSSNGIFDELMAKIQNQFGAANKLKKFLGMSETKSFESGIEECERTDNCERRKYGTMTDLFGIGQSLMNAGTTIIAIAATADALDAVKDMSQLLSMVGIDGSKGAGKWLTIGIDFFSSKAGAIIDLIQVVTSILKPLGYLMFFVGIFVGYWLPILPLLLATFLQLSIALMMLSFILIIPIFAVLAQFSGGTHFYREQAKRIFAESLHKIIKGAGITIAVLLLAFLPVGYMAYEPFSMIYSQGIFAPLISISIVVLFAAAICMWIIKYGETLGEFVAPILGKEAFNASAEVSSAESMAIGGVAADTVRKGMQAAADMPADKIKEAGVKLKAKTDSEIDKMANASPKSNEMQGSKE